MSSWEQVAVGVAFGVAGFFTGGATWALYGAGLGLALGGVLFPPSAEVPDPAAGLSVQTSQYGQPVRYLRGQRKVPGNLLWYGNFQAHEEEAEGGKGGGDQVVGYTYTASLAWGLCIVPEGETASLLRAWKGDEELNLTGAGWKSTLNFAFYNGSQSAPDPHLAQFVPRAPVWKRLCYIVLPNFNLGHSTFVESLTFEIRIGSDEDALPTRVTADILLDDLFGLGLDDSLFDDTSAVTTDAWCEANDLRISPAFERQVSVLDALSHVIAHHNGYIAYEDGKIHHRQLQREVSRGTIRDHHMPRAEGELVLGVTSPGARETSNKVTVEYTKRAAEYVTGTAPVDDMVDIDRFGLRDATVKLDALTSYDRASKMALTLLRKSLAAPQGYSLPFGPQMAGVRPGMVFDLTEPDLDLDRQPVRVTSVSEADDYQLGVELTDEVDVYDLFVTGADSSIPSPPPGLDADPGSVIRPMLAELPAYYSGAASLLAVAYSKSDQPAWAGAAVYRAYSAGGSFTKLASALGSPITGQVIAATDTTIDVELDWDATLASVTSMDALVLDKTANLILLRTAGEDLYCKFQTVELLAPRQWRLSGLIQDLVDFPRPGAPSDVAIGDDFALYQGLRHLLSIGEADRHRTLYFKVASSNFGGYEQSLADVAETPVTMAAKVDTPLPPCNLVINGIGLDGATVTIGAGDLQLAWTSRNRTASGATNFERADAVPEDSDFQNFLVEFWREGVLRRQVAQAEKSYSWTAAEQAADGGSGAVTVRLYQVNALGTSTKLEAVVTFV